MQAATKRAVRQSRRRAAPLTSAGGASARSKRSSVPVARSATYATGNVRCQDGCRHPEVVECREWLRRSSCGVHSPGVVQARRTSARTRRCATRSRRQTRARRTSAKSFTRAGPSRASACLTARATSPEVCVHVPSCSCDLQLVPSGALVHAMRSRIRVLTTPSRLYELKRVARARVDCCEGNNDCTASSAGQVCLVEGSDAAFGRCVGASTLCLTCRLTLGVPDRMLEAHAYDVTTSSRQSRAQCSALVVSCVPCTATPFVC